MHLLLDRFLATQTLEQSIQITQNVLKAFATAEDFTIKMTIAFGDRFDAKVAQGLAQDWSRGDFTALPPLAILSTVEINGAMGAFAKATNTIYLSREYLAQNAGNPEVVASVLLEEVGHYIDWRINEFETPGDEGAIFSALVRQEKLSEQELQQLRSEDDSATIILDGQTIQIEQATFTGTNGDDILPINGSGNSGDDTINPGLGRDTIDGGSGSDLLIVDYSTNPYRGISYTSFVTNGSGGFNGSFYAYKDARGNYDAVTFSNIEQFQITGTNFADVLYGGDLSDTLIGNGGNDTLNGGKGNDVLDAGAGNDTIDAGAGNDTVDAGAGNDTITGGGGIDVIDGGEGVDTLSDANFATATTALTFDDTGTTHDPIILANGTSVRGIEYFEGLQTGSGNDTITYTQARNNTINTGAGNDTINPGLGRDTIDGGSGSDLLIVDYSTNPYRGISYTSFVTNGNGGFNGSFYAYKDAGGNYDTVTFSNIEQFQITGTNFADVLYGGDLSDILIGNGGNDTLNGGKGDDVLDAGAGNDTIDAGAGNDTVDAGAGNDTITGGGGIDVIDGGEGVDTLSDANFATATTALTFDDTGTTHDPIILANGTSVRGIEYFEGLQTGSGNDTITYTQARNNTINTGAGNDTINPGLGRDTIDGGSGSDLLIVDYSTNPYRGISYTSFVTNGSGGFNGSFYAYKDAGGNYDAVTFSNIEQFQITGTNFADVLYGGDLSDILIGNGGNDTLNGGKGDDVLDGGDGNDILIGGLGNDTYVINTTADTITEKANEGTDTVKSSINYTLGETSNLENLTLTGTSDLNGTGNSLNNIITGNSGNNTLNGLGGNDTLDGGNGIDTLIGGDGNDTYIVDTTEDVITETATGGVDTVMSSVSYALGETSNLENLTLTGTSALNGTGNSLNNVITGNSGANILNGEDGIDTLIGGDGNDIYIVDTTEDRITETATGGVDTVMSSVSYTLGETSNLENLTLTGTSALNGTGNSLNNFVRGNLGANILTGLDGDDTLYGGAGSDTLIGGKGDDILTGGFGSDRFTFTTSNEGIDTITDFQINADDIYISAAGFGGGLVANKAIAASQFLSGSGVTAATDSNQRFIYNTSTGALFFDADGIGIISTAIQIATLTNAPTLANTDIFVTT